MKRRGISPVIATVLLIAITLVMALIVFLWFRGINQEAITKFDKNVKLVCEEISFSATRSGTTVYVTNTGNFAIYKMKAKISSSSSHSTIDIPGWPETGLNQGEVYSGSITGLGTNDRLTLIPVLLGKTEKGNKAYTCEERYGLDVF